MRSSLLERTKSYLVRHWWAVGVIVLMVPVGFLATEPLRVGTDMGTEAAAVATLRRMVVAEAAFESREHRYASIGELKTAGDLATSFIDPLANANYSFRLVVSDNGKSFAIAASPGPSWRHRAWYFVDESGLLRADSEREANVSSQVVHNFRLD